ncbi:hypothetical protein [Bacillus sp. NEB1478]|uniref:hypothetical protein n=1 Tax=Bacillus sp. NEB1478 TaxID=3073816 RepID=UPI002873A500|nr:hypothetical protein [Bacillus sp. NEB1478]WNB91603.1 hypothetical protein RGB74_17260 [Bacillus sp. NEB1478]
MITVFMEYKVNTDTYQAYESTMTSVIKELEKSGAADISWYKAADQQTLYVECFQVRDLAVYESIKLDRTSPEHIVYSKIHPFISGGLEKIHCWAFEKMNAKEVR